MNEKVDELFYKRLGYMLNDRRMKLGYSYKYLSKLTGISGMQLDDYFNGKFRIKKETYKIICKALEISPQIDLQVNIGG